MARSLSELVGHQLQAWEERSGEQGRTLPGEGPWITISREVGAGGTEFAYKLGKKLGWKVYDRYFHDEFSVEGKAPRAYSDLDDPQFQNGLNFGMLDEATQFVYVHKMMRAVRDQAREGRAIIIGRGANWFLNPSAGLRLRVVAPVPNRIQRLIEHERLRPDKAAETVKKVDEQRRAFVRRVYNKEIESAVGYDLILNSAELDPSAMLSITLEALRVKLSLAIDRVLV